LKRGIVRIDLVRCIVDHSDKQMVKKKKAIEVPFNIELCDLWTSFSRF